MQKRRYLCLKVDRKNKDHFYQKLPFEYQAGVSPPKKFNLF
jgi:hypothetical protein